MNLLYLTVLDEKDNVKCGILGKIKGQISSFERFGLNVFFGRFSGSNMFLIDGCNTKKNIYVSMGNTRKRLRSIYNEVYSFVINNKINAVYIRFMPLDSKAIRFYSSLKKNGVKVIIEFYSHNLELEAKKTAIRDFIKKRYSKAFREFISLFINKYYFSRLHTCIDRIVTTTEVGDMYGVHTINVTNGIDVSTTKARIRSYNEFDFNIISVAMISIWHGYDRIIRGISEYYNRGGMDNILYTVIGDGEEKTNLEKMVKELNLQDHVFFVGIKLKNELEKYYNEADIALEMLAGFRRTSGKISSIKMAEYFAKGIPVIYASDCDIYPYPMNKFCYRVKNDDSYIDIFKIIEYTRELNNNNKNIEETMHKIAEKQFDWTVTMRKLVEYLLN